MADTVLDIVALAFMTWGVVQSLVAGIGLVRFPDVLTRMHAASKPQMLGVVLVFAGAAVYARSWAVAGFLLVALMTEFLTVPAASSLVGRSAFRRGFVDQDNLVHDELSANLPRGLADTDDTEGFLGDTGTETGEPRAAGAEQPLPAAPTVTEAPARDNEFALDTDEFVNFDIEDEAGEPAQAEYAPADPSERTAAGRRTSPERPEQTSEPETGPGSDDRLV